MKLRLLMSHCKNSLRDTVIGKKWICSDLERGTLQECGPSQRMNVVAMECAVVSFHMLISGRLIQTIREPPTLPCFDSDLELSCHLWVSFSLQIGDQV